MIVRVSSIQIYNDEIEVKIMTELNYRIPACILTKLSIVGTESIYNLMTQLGNILYMSVS